MLGGKILSNKLLCGLKRIGWMPIWRFRFRAAESHLETQHDEKRPFATERRKTNIQFTGDLSSSRVVIPSYCCRTPRFPQKLRRLDTFASSLVPRSSRVRNLNDSAQRRPAITRSSSTISRNADSILSKSAFFATNRRL